MEKIPSEVPDPKSYEVAVANPVTEWCVDREFFVQSKEDTGGKGVTLAVDPNNALLRHGHIDDVHIRTGQKLVIVRGEQLDRRNPAGPFTLFLGEITDGREFQR